MIQYRCALACTLALLLATTSTATLAWAPAGPPPGTFSQPPPSVPPPAWRSEARAAHPRLSIAQRATTDAYLILIRLNNLDPAQVQVLPRGRGLSITYQLQVQEGGPTASSRAGQRGSLRQGTMWMRGAVTRHITLPADAYLPALSSEVSADAIQLSIPRIASHWPMPGMPPR